MRVLLVFALVGCAGKVVEKRVETPVSVPTVEKDLLTAVCLLTLLPPSTGTGNSDAGLIETADGKRRPWIERHYQFLKAEELESNMQWMTNDAALISGMFPSTFCRLSSLEAYATIRIGPPGGPTQVWSGRIGQLQKVEVPGTLTSESEARGVEMVLAAIKADGGSEPRIVFLPESSDGSSPSMSGSWVEAFRGAGAK